MNITEYIKLCCVKGNISLRQIALKAGISPQNLSNKIAKNSFYFRDIEKLADALDADVEIKFINRETGEPII
jgi:transcriptional regulator with XRE-family HTH domain